MHIVSMKNRNLRRYTLLYVIIAPLLIMAVAPFHAAARGGDELEALLDTLDHAINHYYTYAAQKNARIMNLQRQLAQKQQPADRYAVQTLLYDEYYVFDADSAMIRRSAAACCVNTSTIFPSNVATCSTATSRASASNPRKTNSPRFLDLCPRL